MKQLLIALAVFCISVQVIAQTTVFIHTSKPNYLPDEKIWLSAYLLNAATNQPLVQKHPLYVQLYAPDGKLVADQVIATEAGRGSGVLALLPTNPLGIYRLRAFTQSMVLAKQPYYEQRIGVGIDFKPMIDAPITETKDVKLLKIVSDSDTYARRQPIKLWLRTDRSLKATLSVSVYKETTPMPTHAFVLPAETSTSDAPETAEELLYMGRIMRNDGATVADGQVILSMSLPNGQQTLAANTDSTGFFIFKDLVFEGEQTAFWQVNNTKGRVVNDATIHWIKFPRIPLKIDSLPVQDKLPTLQLPAVFVSDGDSLALDAKMLDEVTIKAKKEETPVYLQAMLHKEKDVSFAVNFENDQMSNFYDMLKRLPRCSTSDPPIYLIDGNKVFADGKPEQVVNTRQIKRIEFLRGASGFVYGSTCVYAIYTFGVESKTVKNSTSPTQTVKLNSYQPVKPFYSPNHDGKISNEPDNRQTLYWNPSLVVSPNHKEIPLRFFASDMSGTYRVVAQGMSNLGPVHVDMVFRVE